MTTALRIVVVEDNVLISMDLADLLTGMGHEVCAVARTETEAVAAAAGFMPNLMIVDEHLEEGSGVSAMGQILANGFVPHLYMSGDPSRVLGLVQDAIIVAKPFNLARLAIGIAQAQMLAKAHAGPRV